MGILEIENLRKSFGELVALNNVSLEIEEQTIHSIIGPNGAGKSTMFNLITGLYEPTGGSIYYRDEEITGMAPYKLARRGLARSFQITDIFEGISTRENIRLAGQVVDDQRVSIRKKVTDLDEVNERTEEILQEIGLQHVANQKAGNLDYGNQRKLELGLVMAIQPSVLLLDEPTAGMGSEQTHEMIETIQHVQKLDKLTILLIEHDIEVVMNISDIVTVLHQGSLIDSGIPTEISQNEDIQQAYLGGDIYDF